MIRCNLERLDAGDIKCKCKWLTMLNGGHVKPHLQNLIIIRAGTSTGHVLVTLCNAVNEVFLFSS
jgi:hypothetical protein